jgi:citrate lyase subunit beta / citryl-CoA lyase
MPTSPFQAVAGQAPRPARLRRSYLAVPGSSAKMMAKAAGLPADEVFLDLEDAVAPAEKATARALVVEALSTNDYGDALRVVRVNGVTTRWCHDDIVDLVRGASAHVDCLMIPKVEDAGQLWFVEHLLGELEAELLDDGGELPHRIGVEVLLETGAGSVNLTEISRVTDRTEALLFGPGDYAPDMGIAQPVLGMVEHAYPGHQWHYVMARLVNHARAIGADAVDGPYADFRDADGFVESCTRARLLGFDGKVCIHPAQVELANEQFTPTKQEFAEAHGLLEAYDQAVRQGRGAAAHRGAMIDDASRRMAEKVVARGRAAGMV